MNVGDLVTWLDATYTPARYRTGRVVRRLGIDYALVEIGGTHTRVRVAELRRFVDGPRPSPGQLSLEQLDGAAV